MYLLFFKKCLPDLISRISAIYPDLKSIDLLLDYKEKFDLAISEIQQACIMDIAMQLFKVSMWIKDIDSNFIYHNRSCRDIILATVLFDGILFLKDNDFINNALAPLCLHSDKEVIRQGETLRFIEKALYHNGESRWIDVCKTPTFSPSGRISGTMGTGILINRIVSKNLMMKHAGTLSIEIPIETELNSKTLDDIVKEKRRG